MNKKLYISKFVFLIITLLLCPLSYNFLTVGSVYLASLLFAIYFASPVLSCASAYIDKKNNSLAQKINSKISLSAFSNTCFALNCITVALVPTIFFVFLKMLEDFG